MNIKTSLDQLNLWLAEQGVESRVTFSQEVISEAEIHEAEAALGVKLPSAYAQFIARHGVFFISGELTGRGSGNDTVLLSPSEMVESTQRYRDEYSGSEEPDAEILDDALIFCMDPLDEFFHLFVVSSAGEDGEMKTRPYDYQDPGSNDEWHEGDGDFASIVEEIIATVRKEVAR